MLTGWYLWALTAVSILTAPVYATHIVVDTGNGEEKDYRQCYQESYRGSYGREGKVRVFVDPSGDNLKEECITRMFDTKPSTMVFRRYSHLNLTTHALFWIQRDAVDAALLAENVDDEDPVEAVRSTVARNLAAQDRPAYDGGAQAIFHYPTSGRSFFNINLRGSESEHGGGLWVVDRRLMATLDQFLPPYYSSYLIPSDRLPWPSSDLSVKEKHLASIEDDVTFNAQIATIINSISLKDMEADIRYLTGEDNDSPLMTRHSFTDDAKRASIWIKEQIEKTGASCERRAFANGFSPNVICRYPATTNTTETVLLSGHYDSRGSWGFVRAPGADDDGSGTISVLAIARAIAKKKLTFPVHVELATFAGEEQGLVGSRAYARELREQDANLTLMIQSDMLAYRDPDEPAQLGIPTIGSKTLISLLSKIASIYAPYPELTVGSTLACCSDHQSFHEQGFPAVMAFERAGFIKDPMYHNSGDLSNRTGYDLEQARSITKVTFATLLHVAGFNAPK